MRRLVLGSALLLFAGCNETTAPVATARIEVRATEFAPQTITVDRQTEVTWVNTQPITHTITPDQHTQWAPQQLSTNGQMFTVRLDVPGEYHYFCEEHQESGTITVRAD